MITCRCTAHSPITAIASCEADIFIINPSSEKTDLISIAEN